MIPCDMEGGWRGGEGKAVRGRGRADRGRREYMKKKGREKGCKEKERTKSWQEGEREGRRRGRMRPRRGEREEWQKNGGRREKGWKLLSGQGDGEGGNSEGKWTGGEAVIHPFSFRE